MIRRAPSRTRSLNSSRNAGFTNGIVVSLLMVAHLLVLNERASNKPFSAGCAASFNSTHTQLLTVTRSAAEGLDALFATEPLAKRTGGRRSSWRARLRRGLAPGARGFRIPRSLARPEGHAARGYRRYGRPRRRDRPHGPLVKRGRCYGGIHDAVPGAPPDRRHGPGGSPRGAAACPFLDACRRDRRSGDAGRAPPLDRLAAEGGSTLSGLRLGDGALMFRIEREGRSVQVRLPRGAVFPEHGWFLLVREVATIEDVWLSAPVPWPGRGRGMTETPNFCWRWKARRKGSRSSEIAVRLWGRERVAEEYYHGSWMHGRIKRRRTRWCPLSRTARP